MDFRGDPRPRCSKCSTLNRITPFRITTWRLTSTCPSHVCRDCQQHEHPAGTAGPDGSDSPLRLPEDEKVSIAENYLVPKQIQNNGLKDEELVIKGSGAARYRALLHARSRCAQSEREISKICRKVVKDDCRGQTGQTCHRGAENLEKHLGVKRFRYGRADEHDQVGQVTGLAWTEVGGELLRIETALTPGKGRLTHTGQLGDVMKESIQAAMTVVRSRAAALGWTTILSEVRCAHPRPRGRDAKDGPSAGIGMATSLTSALTGIPVRADVR